MPGDFTEKITFHEQNLLIRLPRHFNETNNNNPIVSSASVTFTNFVRIHTGYKIMILIAIHQPTTLTFSELSIKNNQCA